MNIKSISVYSFLALAIAGCASTGFHPADVSDLAGVYSSAHLVTVGGVKVLTNGYLEIDRAGHVTAFEQRGEGPTSTGSGCYVLAGGTATNAGLQGRILVPGVSPQGEPAFITRAGDDDSFGILARPAADGQMRWFFHWQKPNSTVTVAGIRNVVNAAGGATYSISWPAVASITPEQLRGMLCRSGN